MLSEWEQIGMRAEEKADCTRLPHVPSYKRNLVLTQNFL